MSNEIQNKGFWTDLIRNVVDTFLAVTYRGRKCELTEMDIKLSTDGFNIVLNYKSVGTTLNSDDYVK